jgi:6-phosphogluconolactonase
MIVYVGTYTGPERAEGIYVYRMDDASGALTHLHTVSGQGTDSPSFLALHPNGRWLYAANETREGEGEGPGVSAFAVDAQSHALRFLNRRDSHGTSPCYVSFGAGDKHAMVANYGNGTVSVYPLQQDGQLGDASHVVQHEGSSSHARQAGPHAHSIRPDPAGRYVLAADLGCDRVFVYTLDGATGTLAPAELPYGQVSSGAGPRHTAFHPNGTLLFVNNEIDSSVSAFKYHAERGAMQIADTRSTLPDDVPAASVRNSTAQVTVHPNGRFVYVSNRGHDSIANFGVDAERGKLTPLGHEPTQGKTPRNFNFDPSGRFILAANQNTGNIVTFEVSGETGRLRATGHVTEVPWPVCVTFGPE